MPQWRVQMASRLSGRLGVLAAHSSQGTATAAGTQARRLAIVGTAGMVTVLSSAWNGPGDAKGGDACQSTCEWDGGQDQFRERGPSPETLPRPAYYYWGVASS